MFYSTEERAKIKTYLAGVQAKKLLMFGHARALADALFDCISSRQGDTRTFEEKYNVLRRVLREHGATQLTDAFTGSGALALRPFWNSAGAKQLQQVWNACSDYPFSSGLWRKPFRSKQNTMLYFDRNISLFQAMAYASALGNQAIEEALAQRRNRYSYDYYLAAVLAAELDHGNTNLLTFARGIIYGEGETGVVSRELIEGLLMSHSAEAHKMVGDLLLAAKLQEGLRQSIVETMQQGSREGFLYLLQLILEHDLLRFSSVHRAVDAWTGLGIPPERKAALKKSAALMQQLLTDASAIEACMESADATEIYLALWAICFDEVEHVSAYFERLIASGVRYKKILVLYFLKQTATEHLQNEYAARLLFDEDLEVVAWAISNLLPSGSANQYRFSCSEEDELPNTLDLHALFRRLSELLKLYPKKENTYAEHPFPWCAVTVSQAKIIEKMLLLAHQLDAPMHYVDALVDVLPLMSADNRAALVRQFLKTPQNDTQKAALIQALGDKSSWVRSCAKDNVDALDLNASDYAVVENLLQYKSADLRKNCIELLLLQSNDALLATMERLAQSDLQPKRLGALELYAAVHDEPAYASIALAAQQAVASLSALTQVEQLRAEEIQTNTVSAFTPETGFGLYDPIKFYQPDLPTLESTIDTASILHPSLARIKDVYRKLSDLVHIHREHQFEFERYDGAIETRVLGTQYEITCLTREDVRIKGYPLGEVWASFYEEQELHKDLLAFLYINHCSRGFSESNSVQPLLSKYGLALREKEREQFKQFYNQLPYRFLCTSILDTLFYCFPVPDYFASFYAVAYHLFYAVPLAQHRTRIPYPDRQYGYAQEDGFYFSESSEVDFWLRHVKGAAESDAEFQQYFTLAYSYYEASGYRTTQYGYSSKLDTTDFARAYELGIVEDDEVFYELMGRASSPHHLSALSGQHTHRDHPCKDYPSMLPLARTAMARIIEIEIARGDRSTCVSHLASCIHACYGIEIFATILLKMEKDSYVRGYNFSGSNSTKKNMFSHLLKSCYPNEGDDAARLKELLAEKKVKPSQLVDAAMYAPQWMDIVQDYLGWEGLSSAAWYFHAHTRNYVSQETRAIFARYSAIEPHDFQEGAFDIAWFWDAYRALGEERFQVVYRSAKYVSHSGQHKRAQLYADAVTGKLDFAAAQTRILEKRNKDYLLASALIPLKDKADLLHRYELMQTFLAQAKTFGAQRRASETAAVRIALENLARNAGYADTNRLVWQMEAQKTKELAPLFSPQEIDGCELYINMQSTGLAELVVQRDGKTLKAIPAALKKDARVQHLKSVQKDLKNQHTRARASLEFAMTNADAFLAAELSDLEENPVIAPLMAALVFVSGEKHGYWRKGALSSVHGAVYTLDPQAEVRIAHPADLYAMQLWHDYQTDLFAQALVQPFKQVFREFYRPTFDEELQGNSSKRYAGHQIQPRRALALLKSRGWTEGGGSALQKVDFKENVVVTLFAQTDWFSPADIEAPALETVSFYDRKSFTPKLMHALSPILFSEAMRDVDLVVSVAHAGEVDPEASLSTIEIRTYLLEEMLRLMSIQNVQLRKTHAFIQGDLGEYTVHLGSGMVQKMATGSVYIIPVHSQHRGRLFLPFMDGDPKTAEIISKIILLAEDKKIKDPEILRQIQSI